MNVNIADIILLVLVAIFVFIGWKTGLIKMCMRVISFVLSILLALLFFPLLSQILQNTELYNWLLSVAEKNLPAINIAQSPVIPEGMQMALQSGGEAATFWAADYFAQLMINAIAFVTMLILVSLIMMIIKKLIRAVAELPIISAVDHIAGIALGAVEGVLVVCILLAVVYVVPGIRENETIYNSLESSHIARVVYNNNPIVKSIMPDSEAVGGQE
ncbi:MAG: CvpA family protein [Clostridia bacterium]|nr:CvpA family protein [Clostridia bacterium]